MNTQMQYHNPENVPADKVPKGWRFLTVEEQRHRAKLGNDAPTGCRYWVPGPNVFSINSHSGGIGPDWTYIISDTQPEPAPSPWIAFSERKPTKEDADKSGYVLVSWMDGVHQNVTELQHWTEALPGKYWMRKPPLPAPPSTPP